MTQVSSPEKRFGLTYIATGRQTNGQYFQCSTSIPSGDKGPPLHKHAHESEGFYVVSGCLKLNVDGVEHVLFAGDYFNVMPGSAHTWTNDSGEVVALIITFSPSGIEDMFRELDAPVADFSTIGEKYGMTILDGS